MTNTETGPFARVDKSGNLYYTKTSRRNKFIPGEERRLAKRQIEVLKLRARGKSYKEVAEILGISPKTVSAHLVSIGKIVGSASPIKLLVYALKHRILLDVEGGNPDGTTS